MNLQSTTYPETKPTFNQWAEEIAMRKNKEWQRKKELIALNKLKTK